MRRCYHGKEHAPAALPFLKSASISTQSQRSIVAEEIGREGGQPVALEAPRCRSDASAPLRPPEIVRAIGPNAVGGEIAGKANVHKHTHRSSEQYADGRSLGKVHEKRLCSFFAERGRH